MSDPQATLFHPFEAGLLDMPPPASRVLLLGAEPPMRAPAGFDAELSVVQGFRPPHNVLTASGFAVSPEPQGDGYDLALVLAGRHRGLNEARIGEALRRMRAGGIVVVGGLKETGIAGLRKSLEEGPGIAGSTAKYHGLVFWIERDAVPETVIAELCARGTERVIDGGYVTAPGMFSHERPDRGSALLAQHLPADLSGAVADFCAGWGYLSAVAVSRCPRIRSLDLYEADHASLQAARRNLAAATMPVGFHWRDLVAEKVERRFDAIVMNPPFHQGRAADPGLGRAIMAAAHGALKRGGRLFMVGNSGLPYGRELAALFTTADELVRDGGFRVFKAVK